MKYRIIQEVDGNKSTHFEVQLQVKHWYGFRWENTKRYLCDGHLKVTRTYDTLAEAMHEVNSLIRIRTIVDEGEINGHTNEV